MEFVIRDIFMIDIKVLTKILADGYELYKSRIEKSLKSSDIIGVIINRENALAVERAKNNLLDYYHMQNIELKQTLKAIDLDEGAYLSLISDLIDEQEKSIYRAIDDLVLLKDLKF